MKVLFLTHRLPFAPNRGDRIRAYHLLRVLSRHADVHVVSLAHDADEWSHRHDLAELAASTRVVRLVRWQRLGAAGLALMGRRPLTHVLLHAPAIHRVLRECRGAVRPDVTFAFCSGMARYACEPVLDGLPFVFDLVDVDSHKWRQLADEGRGLQRPVFRREARLLARFESHAIRRAAASTVVSARELAHLSPDDRSRVQVVQNGIDVTSFAAPGPPAVEPRVVFCGVFNYAPNERAAIWFAEQVWPAITRAMPAARLSLVGMHPTPAVRRLAGDPTIEVTGAVPDVRPYLWKSAVAVAPIDIARGVQNKVLEALAAGLPAVVTRPVAEGLPQEVREAYDVADGPDAFAAAVGALLRRTPAERRRMADRATLSGLTWERQLEPMVDLLRRAAAR